MKPSPGGRVTRRAFLAAAAAARSARGASPTTVYVVPNFHPASCGWLTHFSKERVYCANSYLDHLDRVRDDPEYNFVISEVNNLIAIRNFQPERFAELKRRIAEGRVEAVNAFFLESTVNLSGGEALVRLGVEGLRWQRKVLGVKPRFGWMIDICGLHAQMAQICAGLGLDAMVYCRHNPTGKAVHWAESPDGTRILAISPGHYSELRSVMIAKGPLGEKELAEVDKFLEGKKKITPQGAPVLVLAGSADYALAPSRPENPSAFLREWKTARPAVEMHFATLGKYFDALDKSRLDTPVMTGDTAYSYGAFWVQCPRVKTAYRACEHALQAAEMTASAASLSAKYPYPGQALYHAWLQMFLNMDRNTLWGAAGGMVFEHDRSWDARDRFEWVSRNARDTTVSAVKAALKPGDGLGIVNPLGWDRADYFTLPPNSPVPAESKAHAEPDRIVCSRPMRCGSIVGVRPAKAKPEPAKAAPFNEVIATKHCRLRIDPKTGAIVSLKVGVRDHELLSGPANVVLAERWKKPRSPGDFLGVKAERESVATSSDEPCRISAWRGVCTVLEMRSTLLGKPCRRRVWIYDDHPRIDFETEFEDLPDGTVVTAEFPLYDVGKVRRGVPYGFSETNGGAPGILPAVRWSHYEVPDRGGLAIYDRGLSGRELAGRGAAIFLFNAVEKYRGYPNSWLSGAGKHTARYAIFAHADPWEGVRVPQMAWEYNAPPEFVPGCAAGTRASVYEASDNVIVESLRRDGAEIELRMVECLGVEGDAEINLRLPFSQAWVTDMTGGNRKPLGEGTRYKIPVRPQQILTLRFRTEGRALPEIAPLTEWDPLVPPAKRAALHEYTNDKGHPPFGN